MMRMDALIGCALVLLVSLSPADAQVPTAKTEAQLLAAGYKPMSGAQIARLLTGNTIHMLFLAKVGEVQPGTTFKIFYRDSRVRITVAESGPSAGKKSETNWWLEGDLFCGEQRMVKVGHTCSSIYEVGTSYYSCLKPEGNCSSLLRMVPGNPEKI